MRGQGAQSRRGLLRGAGSAVESSTEGTATRCRCSTAVGKNPKDVAAHVARARTAALKKLPEAMSHGMALALGPT